MQRCKKNLNYNIIINNSINCSLKNCKETFINSLKLSIINIKKFVKNNKVPNFMNDVIIETKKLLKKSKLNEEEITKISFHLLLITFFAIIGGFN